MAAIIMTAFLMMGLAACEATDNAGTQKEITDVAVYEDAQSNILSARKLDIGKFVAQTCFQSIQSEYCPCILLGGIY